MLRIYLFGNLRAFDGDVAVPPPHPPKVLLLWAYLLLRREQAIPRDQVAFTLWPDVPEAEARANLRRHLHLLRRYLPPTAADRPWLLTDHHTIQWNCDADYWLDVEVFEQVADSSREMADRPPTEETLGYLQSAIGNYGGDLLENLYEDWVLVERERLRRQYTQVLERLIALQEAAGDLRGATVAAQRLLAHDRLREETHRLVMRLYYLAGNRATALRQFGECQRLLREELDVEPMPETLALRQAIMEEAGDHEPEAGAWVERPTPDLEPPSPVPRPSIPVPRSPTRIQWLLVAVPLVLIVAALLLWRTVRQAPITVTLSGPGVAQDTWITAEIPDTPFDPEYPDELLEVFSQVHLQFYDSDLDRFLIRFDLSALPAGAQIETAIFLIHLETWTAESGRHSLQRAYPATVEAHRIRRPWQPETATYRTPWTQPGLAPGADYDAQPLGSQPVGDTTWLSFDVTPAARDWLAYPDDNWGLMLRISAAPKGLAHYWVDTTEHPSPARRPGLMVTYRPGRASRAGTQMLTLMGADVVDTWIASDIPNATSAAGLRGQSEIELIWVTGAFDDIAPPAGEDTLDIPFAQYPRARLNKGGQAVCSALLRFDLGRLPANARVESADLLVHLEPARSFMHPDPDDVPPYPATIAAYRLRRSWQPDTVAFSFPWAEFGLTPGLDYDADPLDTRSVNGAAWLTFDVTAAVQSWPRGDNYGLLLTEQEATEGLAPYWMATSEFPDPALHPRLQIRYLSD